MKEQTVKQSEELKQAIESRDKFLQRHPNLKIFQMEIDNALDRVKDPLERLGILFKLITKRNNELQEVINEYKIEYNSLPEDVRKEVEPITML